MSSKAMKLCLALSVPLCTAAACPGGGMAMGTPPDGHAKVPVFTDYVDALDSLDMGAVVKDMENLLTDSKECWPADYGNYGPFFIRLAWHCSGTYRKSDNRGGCAGGRQRFPPEADWKGNGNLDYARALLWPIKEKYGDALSWGDLFILAGTTAIKSMGGPITQLCVGRVDDPDGTSSLDLGPSEDQEKVAPCAVNGNCTAPLGATTIGLIYMNPEGPQGNPDPVASSKEVLDVFSRMAFDARETVALIGGGHAFGKAHAACSKFVAPCDNGTFTSGFEGPWTTTPTRWNNEYFKVLKENEWEKHKGTGDKWQWKVKNAPAKYAGLMMLTSDMALLEDDKLKQYVDEFAADEKALDEAFAKAWFKLTMSGGIWAENKKCSSPGTLEFGVPIMGAAPVHPAFSLLITVPLAFMVAQTFSM